MVDRWRKKRAQNQNLFIEKTLGSDQYLVNGSRGYEYAVNPNTPSCECPDWQKRQPEGGCKHIIYVKMETDSTSDTGTTYTDPATGTKLDTSTSGDPFTNNSIPTAYEHKEEWSETVARNTKSTTETDTVAGTKHTPPSSAEESPNTTASTKSNHQGSESKTITRNTLTPSSDQSEQAERIEATGTDTRLRKPIIDGLLFAVMLVIPIEVCLLLISISPGTIVLRSSVLLFLSEILHIIDYITNIDSNALTNSDN